MRHFSGLRPEQAAGRLLAQADSQQLPLLPTWSSNPLPPESAPENEFDEYRRLNSIWLENFRRSMIITCSSAPFRERMVMFWHNHFVTESESYIWAPLAARYINTLRRHAFGNFRQFTVQIGLEGAMLRYLNGVDNVAEQPNENYARELLELFTMGAVSENGTPNYTQTDVEEIARALTGWKGTRDWQVEFDWDRFDPGTKTVFGVSGPFGYDTIIDLLFEQRGTEIAHFMARKFLDEFVHPGVDTQAVEALAETFRTSGFSITALLEDLLTSDLFYNPVYRGAGIKSPVELLVGPFVDLGQQINVPASNAVVRSVHEAGQTLLDPPNVGGWPGHREWLTTETLTIRWLISDFVTIRYADKEAVIRFAENIHDFASTYAALELPVAIARHLLSVPLEWVEVPAIDDPFEGNLEQNPLPEGFLEGPEVLINLAKSFLGNLPWYEWYLYREGAADRILLFIQKLTGWPEYQLK